MDQISGTVALVGRPNVGKSTLFNKLTKTRDALVANVPGLTRDRRYGVLSGAGKSIRLIDTGAFLAIMSCRMFCSSKPW